MDTPPSASHFPPPPPLPPLPTSGGGSFRALAKFSWISVLLCIAVNFVFQGGSSGMATKEGIMGRAIVMGLIMLGGVVSGIIALCAIPKHGSKGLLGPAISGLAIWLVLIVLAVPPFMKVREKALQVRAAALHRVDLTAATHLPGAERLQDAELGLSFDIPSGYEAVPAASKSKQYRYLYGRPNASGPGSVIGVVPLPGAKLPTQHLTAADIPPGKSTSLATFSWRGLPVDGFRVVESTAYGEFITFNVQIPLKKRTVQLGFGAPATQEAATRALVMQTLSSLEGEPNWP